MLIASDNIELPSESCLRPGDERTLVASISPDALKPERLEENSVEAGQELLGDLLPRNESKLSERKTT